MWRLRFRPVRRVGSRGRGPGRRARAARPILEPLEGRRLLSLSPTDSHYRGYVTLFAIGEDGQVVEQTTDYAGNLVGTATLPGRVKAISTVYLGVDGSPLLFAIGMDDQVWVQHFDLDGGSPSGYELTAPGRVKAISAAPTGSSPDLIAVFAVGLDDQVWLQPFDANGDSAGDYQLTTPGVVKSIVASGGNNYWFEGPLVFAIGPDNQVWVQTLHQHADNSLTADPYRVTSPGAVKAISLPANARDAGYMLVVGLDDQVWAQNFASGVVPLGYHLVAPGRVKSIDQTQYFTPTNNRGGGYYTTEVFAIGLDDQVWSLKLDQVGAAIGEYQLTTPGQVQSFRAWHISAGPIVFVVGLDNRIYTQPFDKFGNSAGGYRPTTDDQVLP